MMGWIVWECAVSNPLQTADLREALSWVIRDIHQKGWATGTGGNFSAVLQRHPLTLLMAPSGVDKGLIHADDLIEVDAGARVIAGAGKASAETQIHLTVATLTSATAILHSHSVLGTLLSSHYAAQGQIMLRDYEMLKGLKGIQTHATAVCLPILPNSQDMQVVSDRLRVLLRDQPEVPGFLLAGHGLYTWGDTLFEARRHLEILEFFFDLTYHQLVLANSCVR
jgi:methylthioribulose-1-phosphate dehydratase